MLVRLLYASRATAALNCDVIEAILANSREHNPARGITGILCYSGEIFMQVLEGSRKDVCSLYNKIAQDPRHKDVELLDFEEIGERRFADWTMGQVNLAKVNPSIMLKYSEKAFLDPFATGGKASLALLNELMATASIVGRGA